MNIALIFAGGTGTRMKTNGKPKQFLELYGKAIIIHTIEIFENHPDIDAICVVCLEPYIDYLKKLLKKDDIQKVKWIVPGGSCGQESIFNGLDAVYQDEKDKKDTIVLIHDGVRPLINEQTITDNINCVKKNGSAITTVPAIETIAKIDGTGKIVDTINRSECCIARAPQSFYLNEIVENHHKAIDANKYDFIDSASLMSYYGKELFTVSGPNENIKITTPSDYYIFKAFVEQNERNQVFGL